MAIEDFSPSKRGKEVTIDDVLSQATVESAKSCVDALMMLVFFQGQSFTKDHAAIFMNLYSPVFNKEHPLWKRSWPRPEDILDSDPDDLQDAVRELHANIIKTCIKLSLDKTSVPNVIIDQEVATWLSEFKDANALSEQIAATVSKGFSAS